MAAKRLIVGIDYGTTYSGISWVPNDGSDIQDIAVVNMWPSKNGECKAPTRIAYAVENQQYQLDEDLWGYAVEPEFVACSWTKLLLDINTNESQFDDPKLREAIDQGILRLPFGKTPQQICQDYLRQLYLHLMSQLQKKIPKSVIEATPMDCWLTVPAVWSDQAQNMTKMAAQAAGFGARRGDTISVISEPEAAAIAALKRYMRDGNLNPPQAGEDIMICDCGGGTVDITSYSLKALSPQLVFEELCVGAGGKCGATFLDRNLLELMKTRFGMSFQRVPLKERSPGSEFLAAWENAKRNFSETGPRRPVGLGPIPISGVHPEDWYDSERRKVLITRDDIRGIFDPVVDQVLRLVHSQIDAVKGFNHSIDRLILIGGFGESPYLLSKLRDDRRIRRENIQVYGAEQSQSAVVLGAALRGLQGTAPRKKRCRRHYGVSLQMPFRQGLDPEDKSRKTNWNNEKMCRGRMKWIIFKGEEIEHGTTKTAELTFDPKKGDVTGTTVSLFSCALDLPPEYEWNERVKAVGQITVYWTKDELKKFESKRNHYFGPKTFLLKFSLTVNFGSEGGLLEVRTVVDGKVCGTTTMTFE
ncbi:hsp70-like protein [Polychaeton citri CBS 116435]|uniref:Hsp70-like protein n=1 Tax=Polychaeton citri CBS 116435 TaxID=1314669 RepID=A0A9P4QBZ9_9PEZI|nr:hsp70-like protein [Polychaeton citri CBS 116435]